MQLSLSKQRSKKSNGKVKQKGEEQTSNSWHILRSGQIDWCCPKTRAKQTPNRTFRQYFITPDQNRKNIASLSPHSPATSLFFNTKTILALVVEHLIKVFSDTKTTGGWPLRRSWKKEVKGCRVCRSEEKMTTHAS